MSVSKLLPNLPKDDTNPYLQKAQEVMNEANELQSELLGTVRLMDCIVQNLDELALLQEFRRSKYNVKLEKIKALKSRFNKSFL